MKLLDLEFFKTVAELKSFTKAADALFTTQPAVSRKISNLENKLGVRLLDRKGKNVLLNENGAILLKYTNSIFILLENMKTELIQDNSISMMLLIGLSLLPDLVEKYLEDFSNTSINIVQHYHARADMHDWDLIIFCDNKLLQRDNNKNIHLFTEKMVLAVNKNHPLAGKETVELIDLKNQKFSMVHYDNIIGLNLDSVINRLPYKPNVVFYSDNFEAVKLMVASNIGLSIVPNVSLGFNDNPNIVLKEITDLHIYRYVYLSLSNVRYLTKNVYSFMEFLIKYFEDYSK